jgi:CheY-like chemotaxis protein
MAHILVVEDYQNLQIIYKTALINAGHQVDVVSDGLEALELVKTKEPDLILLDLLLPHMGGLEFIKAYNLAEHPRTAVVVFSNLYSPNLFEEAKGLGIKHYLTKSDFTPEEMVNFVNKALAEHTPAK